MKIRSTSFENGDIIPQKYSCEGENINPELIFYNVPKDAKSLTLIVQDPDAAQDTFSNFLVWNIPPNNRRIREDEDFDGIIGKNDLGQKSWEGPCSIEQGDQHRYYFRLFALDGFLNIPQDSNMETILSAMEGHVLAETKLIGRYPEST
jgi:Raf kinase inhibitor-like YbhB/YbcL family protein